MGARSIHRATARERTSERERALAVRMASARPAAPPRPGGPPVRSCPDDVLRRPGGLVRVWNEPAAVCACGSAPPRRGRGRAPAPPVVFFLSRALRSPRPALPSCLVSRSGARPGSAGWDGVARRAPARHTPRHRENSHNAHALSVPAPLLSFAARRTPSRRTTASRPTRTPCSRARTRASTSTRTRTSRSRRRATRCRTPSPASRTSSWVSKRRERGGERREEERSEQERETREETERSAPEDLISPPFPPLPF